MNPTKATFDASQLKSYRDPLPVMEHFYTIQGEGMHNGKAAYFIRLAGCDVGCVWCDVKESWSQDGYPLFSVDQLIELVLASGTNLVVITGGEPLMHNLDKLTEAIVNNNIQVHIETSGAHSITGTYNWICLSPKKFVLPKDEIYKKANELKVIVYNKSDLQWGVSLAEKINTSCIKTFQPEWSREKEMLPLIIEFVKKNPTWRISLQTHKYMNIP